MAWEKVKAALEENGFKVTVFADSAAATEYIDGQLDGTTIGIGGSMTIEKMGLYEKLSRHNTVYWHWRCAAGEDKQAIYRGAQTAEIYLSSVNGLAETGELINIDGSGNRVSAIQYGHRKVYLVVGKNKLAPTYAEALSRARNIAAPLNAQRLKKNTPCAAEGKRCYDCNSPERICRGLSVLWKKPTNCDYEVVLIDEVLGY